MLNVCIVQQFADKIKVRELRGSPVLQNIYSAFTFYLSMQLDTWKVMKKKLQLEYRLSKYIHITMFLLNNPKMPYK
jgi:hypothetical protein